MKLRLRTMILVAVMAAILLAMLAFDLVALPAPLMLCAAVAFPLLGFALTLSLCADIR